MHKYKMACLATQETRMACKGGGSAEIIKTSDGKSSYTHYHSGNNAQHGVGLIFRSDQQIDFHPISDRICMATTKLESETKNSRKLVVICAYAPTLPYSQKHPETRESFYDELNQLVSKCSKRDTLIMAGDFNAETGSAWTEFKAEMGPFGKGM